MGPRKSKNEKRKVRECSRPIGERIFFREILRIVGFSEKNKLFREPTKKYIYVPTKKYIVTMACPSNDPLRSAQCSPSIFLASNRTSGCFFPFPPYDVCAISFLLLPFWCYLEQNGRVPARILHVTRPFEAFTTRSAQLKAARREKLFIKYV